MPACGAAVATVPNAAARASLLLPRLQTVTLPQASEGDVCVWAVDLDLSDDQVAVLHDLLSPDERERASRFAFPHLRRRFTSCRGALRVLLGSRLGLDPSRLQFEYGPYGKPSLAAGDAATTFNVSHAGDRAVIVTARQRRVGIDIERMTPLADQAALVATVFTEAERRALAALPPGDRAAGFYAGWTRKEAFVKALGLGLAQPLTECDVTVVPAEPARLLRHEGDAAAPARWAMWALRVGEGYAAALCYERVPFGTPSGLRLD